MSAFRFLFGFEGRIGRRPFLLGLLATVAAFAAGIHLSEQSLPWMAEIFAPRGINAAFVLHAIWTLLAVVAGWTVLALTAKRLHDRGRSGWWGALALLPLAALAVLNDALFLASRTIAVPSGLQLAVLLAAGVLGLWVLFETLILPGNGS
ncbi:MAG TPA: DUF805 domain-containing protein [Hyphomicrobiaceae bacterium]|nr:DUF805 domain-containing protein [Hyphomicrobiaceae bacterium]